MGAPRWLKLFWLGLCTGVSGVGTFILWTVWLALTVLLLIQIFIANAQELTLPGFVLRQLEARLAAAGWRATFASTRFDPTGHILIEDLRLWIGPGDEPLITADSAHIEIDPWALLLRDVQIEHVRVNGSELRVPALLSPTGRADALLSDLSAEVRAGNGRRGWQILHLAGRAGGMAVQVEGHLPAQTPARTTQPSGADALSQVAQRYHTISRQVARALAQLPPARGGSLTVRLRSDEDGEAVAVSARVAFDELQLPSEWTRLPQPISVAAPEALLTGRLAWLSDAPTELALQLRAARAETNSGHVLEQPGMYASGSWHRGTGSWSIGRGGLAAAHLTLPQGALATPTLTFDLTGWPQLGFDLAARLAGETWRVHGNGNLTTRSLTASWTGAISEELIAQISARAPRDLTQLLQVEHPPQLAGSVTVEQGRPAAAAATVTVGAVVARGVQLQGASASLHWAGQQLRAEDIWLTTADSEARGRYEMDLTSREFRFLLAGHLQPSAINGWFRDWWPRFWSNFDFSAAAPAADVDIRGRWGDPSAVRIFVAADATAAAIKGAKFDRVRTRLLFRPGFTDVIEFIGERGGNDARGRFTHGFDLQARTWTEISFDVRSDMDLGPAPHLFGDLGEAVVRPFAFNTPPRLHAHGTVTSAASRHGQTADVQVVGDTVGDWTFYYFPLNGLSFRAHLRDDTLLVEDIDTRFAGGRARGRVELQGFAGEERLAFDASLTQARLGESIRTLEEWSARREGRTAAPVSRFQRQIAGGRLDLALSAVGTYRDPTRLRGAGHGVITGADLGEVNLLGVLSALLRPTIFNFTTLQLDTAHANFELADGTLDFGEVRVTGPRAAIDADGTYELDTRMLSFLARVRPFDTPGNIFSATVSAVLAPLTSVLEVKLTGPIDQPAWAFVYGPTNLLRSIAGDAQPVPSPAAPEPTTETQPVH